MKVKFACKHCGQQYAVQDSARGKQFKCKKCGKAMRVPQERTNDGEAAVDLGATAPIGSSPASSRAEDSLGPSQPVSSSSRSTTQEPAQEGAPWKLPALIGGVGAGVVAVVVLLLMLALRSGSDDQDSTAVSMDANGTTEETPAVPKEEAGAAAEPDRDLEPESASPRRSPTACSYGPFISCHLESRWQDTGLWLRGLVRH